MFEQRTERDKASQMNVCGGNQSEGRANAKVLKREHVYVIKQHKKANIVGIQ